MLKLTADKCSILKMGQENDLPRRKSDFKMFAETSLLSLKNVELQRKPLNVITMTKSHPHFVN